LHHDSAFNVIWQQWLLKQLGNWNLNFFFHLACNPDLTPSN
jgi:hypothetical protein